MDSVAAQCRTAVQCLRRPSFATARRTPPREGADAGDVAATGPEGNDGSQPVLFPAPKRTRIFESKSRTKDAAMRFRQVHLDFHTSELVPDIASQFDDREFAEAYKSARVDSVNLFAKCHHGLSYHPTDVGRTHPNLGIDLLGRQIDALQSAGIKTPIYLSANWDEHAARTHPEWRVMSPAGDLPRQTAPPNGAGWAYMDFASDYLDYLCAQIDEVASRYSRGDGFWIDIAWQPVSVSEASRRGMAQLGLDWTREADREEFNSLTVTRFFERVRDTVKKHDPDCPLFFNSGHIRKGFRRHYAEFYSHLEIESLPTGGWGYDDFPLSARYVETTGEKIPRHDREVSHALG